MENSPKQTLSIEDQLKLEREIVRVMEESLNRIVKMSNQYGPTVSVAADALARVAEIRKGEK